MASLNVAVVSLGKTIRRVICLDPGMHTTSLFVMLVSCSSRLINRAFYAMTITAKFNFTGDHETGRSLVSFNLRA